VTPGIKLGWAFFGLIVVVMLGYGLTRGVYVGSTTKYNSGIGSKPYYSYHCRYLYADGVRLKFGGGTGATPEEAADDDTHCPFLANDN